jgi:gliding motility-associated-like protein
LGGFDLAISQTNIPPNIVADGNQMYCPLGQINIVANFDIIDPDDTEIEALHIQIAQGYSRGSDVLTLTGTHPNIVDTWNANEGKLSLRGIGGTNVSYSDLIAAVYAVQFSNSSTAVSGTREFSFTIGDANYLPSTGHYYEFIRGLGVTWLEAKIAAETSSYFGLQGYLATITTSEEAQLSGEQAPGTGWIGGSDAAVEGVWRWMTGPEKGTIFWNGDMNGSSPNYANWNTGEPNNSGDEDYAHVTAPGLGINGSWNDLRVTGSTNASSVYHPQGYIVEYGGTPGDPIVDISASTQISVAAVESSLGAELCGPGTLLLEAIPSAGTIFWFDVQTGGIPLGNGNTFTTPAITTTATYYALASTNGCLEGDRTAVIATVHTVPAVTANIVFQNCDEDGVPDGYTDYNLNEINDVITFGNPAGMTFTYYLNMADAIAAASNTIAPIPFNNSSANTVYVRVESPEGCFDISTVDLQVSTTSFPNGLVHELAYCDDDDLSDGIRVFDLTQASQFFLNEFPAIQGLTTHYYRNLVDAQLEQNEIGNPSNYTNETPFSQVLYVRVEDENNGACFGIGPHLNLVVHPRPEFEVDTSATLCTDGAPVILGINAANGMYAYEWTDENGSVVSSQVTATINSGGIYNVVATSNEGCDSFPVSVTVLESAAAVIENGDITVNDFSNNNKITINNQNNSIGIGDYEFALDNSLGPYQDEPVFYNVDAGIHTIYAKDKNGCGITEKIISVLGYPKFFTPNNDGFNDTWNLIGWSNDDSQSASIFIYNRYGKLLKNLSPESSGWDGTFNGTAISSSDYWFAVNLVKDDGTAKVIRGHFSLIR